MNEASIETNEQVDNRKAAKHITTSSFSDSGSIGIRPSPSDSSAADQ